MSLLPLIDIQVITYAYPAQKKDAKQEEQAPVYALRELSLQIQQGEYVVVLGHVG